MKILVADDDLTTRVALAQMLDKWGYEAVTAEDGGQAWRLYEVCSPDVAILDWMMPEVDGPQLCRRIRQNQDSQYTYVILLTCRGDRTDVTSGLDSGAVDYICKPFDAEVLRSRLGAAERIIKYERLLTEKNAQLQRYSTRMEQLAEERSRHLVHAERMASVGLLSAGIAHEINNPTTFISGNVQTLERFWQDIEPFLIIPNNINAVDRAKLNFVAREMPGAIQGIRDGVRRISKIVNGLMVFCRKDQEALVPCDTNACIEQALDLCHNALKRHVTVATNLATDLPNVLGDCQQLEQVFINLFTNAADAMEAHGSGTLTVSSFYNHPTVVATVADSGCGIPENMLNDIWQPFYTTKPPGKGTGLGLYTVLGIIERHHGSISVQNQTTGGALFRITLPALDQGERREGETAHS